MGRSRARLLLPGTAVLVLVGLVAIAAPGSTPLGTSELRRPSETMLDTFFTLWTFLLFLGAILLVYALLQRKAIAEEIASGRYPRASFATFAVLTVVFAVAAYVRARSLEREMPPTDVAEVPFTPVRPLDPSAAPETTYEPAFAVLPALAVLLLGATALAAVYLSARRSHRATRERPVAHVLADVLEETLDDLRAEADPRRAVISAYARLERVLAARGLPRRSDETPDEYLARILRELDVDPRSVRRLTGLFERAKFSDHEVDSAMKEDAIGALEQTRDELRRQQERERPDGRRASGALDAREGHA